MCEFVERLKVATEGMETRFHQHYASVIVLYPDAAQFSAKVVGDLTRLVAAFEGTDVAVDSFDASGWGRFLEQPFGLRVFFRGVTTTETDHSMVLLERIRGMIPH